MFRSSSIIAVIIIFGFVFLEGCSSSSNGNSVPPGISGTIQAAFNSAIDSDVNDPFAPFSSNDDFSIAQSLSNPVNLGGFASAVATGQASDRFGSSTDQKDIYRISLAKNQRITLNINDFITIAPAAIDLDLLLYDVNDTTIVVAESLTKQQIETIVVPSSGEFYLEVKAFNGISKYTLTIGLSIASVSLDSMVVGDDFVSGELLVHFKDLQIATGVQIGLNQKIRSLGLVEISGGPGRPYLLNLGDKNQRNRTLSILGVKQNTLAMSDAAQLKFDTLNVVKALRRRDDVLSADLNYIRHAHQAPNDTLYPRQWNYPLINLPQAWDITTGSSSVIVAVIDSGVFLAHSDLSANLSVEGYDFISDITKSLDGDGIDPNPDDPGDNALTGGSTFHGTHVAGTVAASSNNNNGVAGASWDTQIMPLRVLGQGGTGTSNDFINAIKYAARLDNDSGVLPAQRADIINMSFGSPGFSQTEQNAIIAARAVDVIVIASAGNDNNNTQFYPASYPGVISVSAIDFSKQLAPYSNYGVDIDVTAPGGNLNADLNGDAFPDGIYSTIADDFSGPRLEGYRFYQGTSMATPHVSGIVALMKAIYPGLTPVILDNELALGNLTEDLANNGAAVRDDNYGYGLIDAIKAAQSAVALSMGILPPILVANPSSLNFGSSQTGLTIATSNAGAGTLVITNTSVDEVWLTLNPTSVDSNNLGTYTAAVNRAGLSDGVYSATITYDTDVPTTLNIPVSMQVGTGGGSSNDAGLHYVVLLDPTTAQTVRTVSASISGGSYNYTFSGIPAGSYHIVAGTDLDNDGFICDPGEACGGYPTVNQLSTIQFSTNSVAGFDFTTGFSGGFSATTTSITIPEQGYSRLNNN